MHLIYYNIIYIYVDIVYKSDIIIYILIMWAVGRATCHVGGGKFILGGGSAR